MQELQQTIDLFINYVRGVWANKRYIIIATWLICPVGFLYVATMPDEYQSDSKVYVDTRSVLQPLLRGLAIQSNPEQEIQMMARTLLSRSNLETIARESDLDLQTSSEDDFNRLVTGLSSGIQLRSTGRDNIYTISYSNTSPNVAQKVVQETLNLFVEGALGNNRKDTDTAGRFLDEQIAEYESRLSEAESRLSDFKRKYNDVLPGSGGFYSTLEGLRASQEETQLQLKQTNQQIETLRAQFTNRKRNDFSISGGSEDSLKTRYDDRIQSLEADLDRLTLRFTEKHPDVIETRALLESLEESREKEIEAFISQDDDESGRGLSELSRELRLEVSRLESEEASLKVKEEAITAKITDLELKVDLIPQIEAESQALNRDYGITKEKYEELLSRRESADLSRRADVSAEELKFRIIEPPRLPLEPTGPNRLIYNTGILFVGFGVGVAIAFLISQFIPVLHSPKQLLQFSEYPIWGTVSHLNEEKVRKVHRYKAIGFVLSCSLIFVLYITVVILDRLHFNLAGVL